MFGSLTDAFVSIVGQNCNSDQLTGAGVQRAVFNHTSCDIPAWGENFTMAFYRENTFITSKGFRCDLAGEKAITIMQDVSVYIQIVLSAKRENHGYHYRFDCLSMFTARRLKETLEDIPERPKISVFVRVPIVNNAEIIFEDSPRIIIKTSSGTVVVGEPLTLTVEIAPESQAFYTMKPDTFTLSRGEDSVQIMIDGCPHDFGNSLSMSYTQEPSLVDDAFRFDLTFDAFIPGNGSYLDNVNVVTMVIDVILCNKNNVGQCFNPAVIACFGGPIPPPPVRKRRQDRGQQNIESLNSSIIVFTQEESRNSFMKSIREEMGITDATRIASKDDMCINKTFSTVILVTFVVGMFLCLLATMWMFMQLRKYKGTTRDQHKS